MENEYSKSLKQQYLERLTGLHQFIYIELPQKIMTESQVNSILYYSNQVLTTQTNLYNLIENGLQQENEKRIQSLIQSNASLSQQLVNLKYSKQHPTIISIISSGKDFSFDNKENLEMNLDLNKEIEHLKQKIDQLNQKLTDKHNDLVLEKNKKIQLEQQLNQLTQELQKQQTEQTKINQETQVEDDQKSKTFLSEDQYSQSEQQNIVEQKLEKLENFLVEQQKDFEMKQELQYRSFEDRIQQLEQSMELKLLKIQSENQKSVQDLQLKMSFRLDKKT